MTIRNSKMKQVCHACWGVMLLILVCSSRVDARFAGEVPSDVALIPFPKEAQFNSSDFVVEGQIDIVMDKGNSPADRFAANEFASRLNDLPGVAARIVSRAGKRSIVIDRKGAGKRLAKEGYHLSVGTNQIVIQASDDSGVFYGIQTVMQLLRKVEKRYAVKGAKISDWPDTAVRAVHYDTKHHQDKRTYVESMIRELAAYKINMLVWEWEDKFEYPSHPEIGAPGAFTMKEMQELTRYAQQYHVQIVPLVQGLGHVSFILKWPKHAHLREIAASNFEFCPLKEGTYDLLADLWKDAVEATPGSEYIHIGSDETYELGACPACKEKEKEIGKSGLYHLFIGKSADKLEHTHRQVMAWEAPMGWAKGRLEVYHTGMKQEKTVTPRKGIVLTESYHYETPDLKFAKEAKSLGYPVFAYDPNPGIEQLFLPYFFTKGGKEERKMGSLENSYIFLKQNMGKGVFDGVIRTSWDDSGLPMQAWVLSFATTAAYSWNVDGYALEDFTNAFYTNRYGQEARDMDSLYHGLNEAAYFYMESFERRVWAWGEIGKTHIPDLPRGDAVEYDPFWNTRYKDRVQASAEMLRKMDQVIAICDANLARNVSNKQDIFVFRSMANLVRHTALSYQDLSLLEITVRMAHQQRFLDVDQAYKHLKTAESIVAGQLARRKSVFDELVAVWSTTMLPKGMSTAEKKYFFEQDRTRHFANRTADMTYLIVDEQHLGLENYLSTLREYNQSFYQRFLK
jgi:hexosaminidase